MKKQQAYTLSAAFSWYDEMLTTETIDAAGDEKEVWVFLPRLEKPLLTRLIQTVSNGEHNYRIEPQSEETIAFVVY